ncbi:MAG: InlB B-repeat-containing protein [Lachnospiraceae bacterium]|nr:InlB B-repeat-containing protein [Lachnospiraceae bacterium]
MKKMKLLKRIAVLLLAVLLMASNTVVLYAGEEDFEMGGDFGDDFDVDDGDEDDDDDSGDAPSQPEPQQEQQSQEPVQEVQNEPDINENQNETPAPSPQQTVKKLTADKTNISLGSVSTSDKPRPAGFVIKNAGTGDVMPDMLQLVDTSGIFYAKLGDGTVTTLKPNATIQGAIGIKDVELKPGDYTATLVIGDLNEPANQITINASLRVENAKPVVTKVKISPSSISLQPGNSVKFEATVEGENNPDTSVDWKVQGAASSDTRIGSDGSLTIGKGETASSLTVLAVSNQDSDRKSSAKVSIAKGSFTVNVRCKPDEGGWIDGQGSYETGDRATLTAIPDKGYKFVEWLDANGEFESGSKSFKTQPITGNMEFTAVFERSGCTISVKSADKDKGSVKGGGSVDYGGSMTIEAEPKSGYTFDGWYENDKRVSKDKKFKIKDIKKDHTYYAEFSSDKYTVKVSPSPSEGGKVSGDGKFKSGESTTITATANKGYKFKGFILNNQVVTTESKFKVNKIDRDLSFTAYFEKDGVKSYTITSGVANKGGVISPSGKTAVAEGNSITYAMAPDNGYAVLAVAVDGKQVGAVTSYTFKDVKGDHTIAVAFAPKQNSVKQVKMDKIISTEEAAAIAVAKLEAAGADVDEMGSNVITAEAYAAMKNGGNAGNTGNTSSSSGKSGSSEKPAATSAPAKTEDSVEEIVVPQEQNLIGMDDTEGLGEVVDTYNPDMATGVYQSLDITEETAEKLIDSGDDSMLINQAYEDGYLSIIINNDLVVPGEDDDILTNDRTVKNFDQVVSAALTKEEKLALMNGEQVMLSFTVSGADGVDEEEEKVMGAIDGVAIDKYLYMTLLKSVGGAPETVRELNSEMEITLEIPESLRNEETKFCIIRDHDGQVDVLDDIDSDPNTITIKTDRFSPYALGHYGKTKGILKGGIPNFVWIIIAVVVGVVLTLVILTVYSRAKLKKRARNRRGR